MQSQVTLAAGSHFGVTCEICYRQLSTTGLHPWDWSIPFGYRTEPTRLTRREAERYLISVSFGRSVSLTLLAFALATYGFDCWAESSPQQAMRCCHSMPCSHSGKQHEDCCRSMPTVHGPFVQSPAVHNIALVDVASAITSTYQLVGVDPEPATVRVNSHGPPGAPLRVASPIRI